MDKIEALVRVSARLGMFDDLAKGMLEFAPSTVRFDIQNVNYEDPTGDDAILLFRIGMGFVNLPHLSEYVNHMWRMRSPDAIARVYKEEVIKAGLEALHRHITERSKNAIRKEPHRQVP
jgi:hypothetical protein